MYIESNISVEARLWWGTFDQHPKYLFCLLIVHFVSHIISIAHYTNVLNMVRIFFETKIKEKFLICSLQKFDTIRFDRPLFIRIEKDHFLHMWYFIHCDLDLDPLNGPLKSFMINDQIMLHHHIIVCCFYKLIVITLSSDIKRKFVW